MPHERREITRADLPPELTPEALRAVPMSTLRRLARPGNGVLSPEEQRVFDAALHQVMSETAGRVARRLDHGDWESVRRTGARPAARRGGRASGVEEQLRRVARRIDDQVDAAEALAPGVDWSFAQSDTPDVPTADRPPSSDAGGTDTAPDDDVPDASIDAADDSATDTPADTTGDDTAEDDGGTVSDLEDRLNEQVELVQVMNEIADVGRRTYELEQQRDLQNTRTVFFGFVVSVAVLVAGWAPLVAAEDWTERWWVIGLTLGTCALAGGVYALVRRVQMRRSAHEDADGDG